MSNHDEIFQKYVLTINEAVSCSMKKERFSGRDSCGLKKMIEAMDYSLENSGKRIRPVLTLEFCRLCSGDPEKAVPFALGCEMVHTYSLIHDDLPCMDDDDMRRGKPSNHVVFGEAQALLAGDALLTLAFETVLSAEDIDFEKRVKAGLVLSKAAGCSGMIAGQVMDLMNESRTATLDEIKDADEHKTGDMIRAAAAMGCIAAGASEEQMKAADEYSACIGLAFQIVDDILDVTSTGEILGKPIGSDSENEKSTYVSLLGLERSERKARELTEKAKEALTIFGEEAEFLRKLADDLVNRKK